MNKKEALDAILLALEEGRLIWSEWDEDGLDDHVSMWDKAFEAHAFLTRDPLELAKAELITQINEYCEEDWKMVSWEFHFHKDQIQIETLSIVGVDISDAQYDDLLHAFYNEVDYWALYHAGITEVTND